MSVPLREDRAVFNFALMIQSIVVNGHSILGDFDRVGKQAPAFRLRSPPFARRPPFSALHSPPSIKTGHRPCPSRQGRWPVHGWSRTRLSLPEPSEPVQGDGGDSVVNSARQDAVLEPASGEGALR